MDQSKFSTKLKKIDISGIRKMFESAGPEAINLGLGQPDFDTPEHIKKAAISAINDGFTGYTEGQGILELREALVNKFKRDNNLLFNPSDIIVTSGASEALQIALASLIDQNDEILVPNPGFVSYKALTDVLGGKSVPVPLSENLTLNPDELLTYITPETKAFIINSPSNPTGGVQTKKDIRDFAQIADDYNITLISDEVYEHFIYEGEHVSPGIYSDNVITINAVSKTFSMTGWRLGYVAANETYINQMLKVHQYVQACASSISQKAAVAAINGPIDDVIKMRKEFQTRRDFLLKSLKSMGIDCVEPKGAFYAFPYVGDDYLNIVSNLLSKGVIVVPGSAFGDKGKGYIRISYANSVENIKLAMEIMSDVIRH